MNLTPRTVIIPGLVDGLSEELVAFEEALYDNAGLGSCPRVRWNTKE